MNTRFISLSHALAAALLWGLALLLAACLFENEKVSAGGGSDTETISGVVRDPDGAPSARTLVKLVPADYDPSRPDTARIRRTLSDANGVFLFEKLDSTATYNLIAGKADEKSWAFEAGLRTGPNRLPLDLALAKVFLFTMHSSAYEKTDSGVAYFPGTDILARCDGLSASRVDSVPEGALRIIVQSRAGWQYDTTLAAAADTMKVNATKSLLSISP